MKGGKWTESEDEIIRDAWAQHGDRQMRLAVACRELPHRALADIKMRADAIDGAARAIAVARGMARATGGLTRVIDQPPLKLAAQAEIIYGWRVWRAITNGRDAILFSITNWTPWPVARELVAHDLDQHDTFRHTGIHAFKVAVPPDRYSYAIGAEIIPGAQLVHGQIALWGRVIEHEDGYRAEYAYTSSVITAEEDLAAAIRRSYGIECFTK